MPKPSKKNVSIKITSELALQMLPHMQTTRDSLATQLKSLDEQIAKIKRAVHGETQASNQALVEEPITPRMQAAAKVAAATLQRSVSGRAPKGASKQVIIDLFKKHPGQELSFNDVSGMSGVKISTTHRILQKMYEDGEIVLGDGGAWKWNQAA